MARLPRRNPVSASSTAADLRLAELDGRGSALEQAVSPLDAGHGVDERGPRRPLPEGDEGVELDAAIESMLSAGGVDPVTRVRLSEARRAIAARGSATEDVGGTAMASLSGALFRYVMPRLHHPEVLRTDSHRLLLEKLADGLAATAEDGVVRDGALVIHRELRRLALLRAGRNALVEG
ncbi:hypothetical protein [Methylobacterium brachythecii]|uniref:Uncharacterized protein n=1 Tax=Methylobacterium brachythecii TaxID=1176177 RepID=A0A7W6AKD8_9HYPH|nr:hypothetical protein [Methylobacterium brachythecii]MBB3903309.1 hypothetical protein [Methylobacterium brachythecii]GLS46841.1 hypothetical protein GCM10007884_48380 [Methylobacterium brachythecii]